VAWEVFDRDPICDEFKRIEKLAKTAAYEEQLEDDDDVTITTTKDDEEKIAKGRHYMVFGFQNWSGKHKSIHFVAARWSLETTNSRWIRKAARAVISMLATFSMYVVGLAYDGASENRSWMKRTLKITLREMIPELIHDPDSDLVDSTNLEDSTTTIPLPPLNSTERTFKEDELPLDVAVGYSHPSVKGITIFALADFSHGIKKVTNAVDAGMLRGINGRPITMSILRDVYKSCPDYITSGKQVS